MENNNIPELTEEDQELIANLRNFGLSRAAMKFIFVTLSEPGQPREFLSWLKMAQKKPTLKEMLDKAHEIATET